MIWDRIGYTGLGAELASRRQWGKTGALLSARAVSLLLLRFRCHIRFLELSRVLKVMYFKLEPIFSSISLRKRGRRGWDWCDEDPRVQLNNGPQSCIGFNDWFEPLSAVVFAWSSKRSNLRVTSSWFMLSSFTSRQRRRHETKVILFVVVRAFIRSRSLQWSTLIQARKWYS